MSPAVNSDGKTWGEIMGEKSASQNRRTTRKGIMELFDEDNWVMEQIVPRGDLDKCKKDWPHLVWAMDEHGMCWGFRKLRK